MKMKLRTRRRSRLVLAFGAGLLLLALLAVNLVWPAALGVFVTVGGAFGALMVIYEVRLTKRLAQAEFIRELQSGFTSDPNV